MLEVTVKTLDGKNRTFCVPDDITVEEFKVKIANSIEIPADSQRLIFQGRVLQDDKKLNDYDVNGSVLHVVQRAPPGARGTSGSSSGNTSSQSYMQGSFSMNTEMREAGQVQNVVEQVLSGMGEVGRNAQVSARSSADGSAVEVHINLSPISPPQVQSGSQLRINQARRMVHKANKTLHKLENPSGSADSSGRHSPMDAETASENEPDTDGTSAEGATANPPAADGTATSGSDSSQPTGGSDGGQNRGPRHPTADVLAELLQQVIELNSRLEPHLERYHRITHEDMNYEGDDENRRDAQRVQNLVSQALHYISHVYHHISDLMIDMNAQPPRQVRAPPTSIVQQAPAEFTISPHHVRRNNTSQTTSTRSTTPTSSTATTSNATRTSTTTADTTSSTSSQAGPIPSPFGNLQLPPEVHIQTTPISNTGGMPNPENLLQGGATAHSGPFVFMEQLGPNTVTVNSIQVSATAVPDSEQTPTTTSGANTSSNNANTTQTPPTNTGTGTPNARPTMGFRLPAGGFPPGPIPFMRGAGPRIIVRQRGTNPQGMGPGGTHGMPGMPGGIPLNIGGMPPWLQILQGMRPPGAGPAASHTSTSSASTGRTTSTNASTASTSTSTSTSTSSASAGTQTRSPPDAPPGQPPMGFMIPGPLPPGALPGISAGMPAGFMAIPSLPGADPFLPCQSRHLIGQRAQARANQGQADGLGGMVSEIVQGLMRQQNPHLQTTQAGGTGQSAGQPSTAGAPGANAPNPFANLFSHVSGAPAGAGRPNQQRQQATSQGSEPPFVTAFRNILQQGNQSTRSTSATTATTSTSSSTTTSSNSNNSSSSASQQSEISDEVFTQLVAGVSGYVAQAAMGQQPTDTISDFLGNLGQSYNIPQGEGLLTDIFNCVARTLTFTDFMAVFYGQPDSLGRLRAPLRELITNQVLENRAMNDENLNQAVEKLLYDMQPDIESACAEVEGKDGVDYKATVNEFLRHQLKLLIRMIMNSTESESAFGAQLYATCRTAIHQFAAMSRHCLRGGEQDIVKLVEGRVRHLSRDVNPVIRQWMVSISSQEATSLLSGINVPVSDFERFIVRRSAMETSPGGESSDNSYMSADEAPQANKAKEVAACNGHAEEVMEVDSVQAAAQVRTAASEVDLSPGGIGIPPEVLDRLPPPPVADPADDTSVSVGSNNWHSQVPSDWVPVITRDVNRQRRQAPSQAPFSDAYLNGMSAKRRRIVAHQKAEHSCAIGDLKSVVPEAIKKAAQSAGVEPIASHEEISRDVASNSALCSAFEAQICDSVQQRLETDPDYIPEKYPKAERFFNKK